MYIRLDEAAARSRKSRATLKNWVVKGRIPAIRDDDHQGTWMVLDRDLERLLGRRLAPTRMSRSSWNFVVAVPV